MEDILDKEGYDESSPKMKFLQQVKQEILLIN
jgi:hypothetical protein